ncbi:hypothetical protein WH87_16435 [Devosia epidermidihirudinis]|uniref:Uncharacterized protein n=1 Tax=Devosia epidermidihirudinis TaxID=1293439 RepID=A0A0F5Q4T9_9HYPH|nr:hypothetical protein [Devosia epidermidihirudinis]KKC35626.1 hypothetical protein WH87_16435 [Devosia epidermidihirudinis]
MKSLVLALAMVVLTPLASGAEEMRGLSPTQLGEVFCMAYLSGDEDLALAISTPVLATAVAHAVARNDAIARANPDDKPPLGDGVPWMLAPDYASICTVGEIETKDGIVYVPIHYAFPDDPNVTYDDKLELGSAPGPYGYGSLRRVDNVLYGDGGSLQSLLVSIFDQ